MPVNDWRNAAPMDFNAMVSSLSGQPFQPPVRNVGFQGVTTLAPSAPTINSPGLIQGGLVPGVSPGVPNIGSPGLLGLLPTPSPGASPGYGASAPGFDLAGVLNGGYDPGALPMPVGWEPVLGEAVDPVAGFDSSVNAPPPVARPDNPWVPNWLEGMASGLGDAFANTGFGPNHGTGIAQGSRWEGQGGLADLGNGFVDPAIGGINPDSGRNFAGSRGSLGFGRLRQPRNG